MGKMLVWFKIGSLEEYKLAVGILRKRYGDLNPQWMGGSFLEDSSFINLRTQTTFGMYESGRCVWDLTGGSMRDGTLIPLVKEYQPTLGVE